MKIEKLYQLTVNGNELAIIYNYLHGSRADEVQGCGGHADQEVVDAMLAAIKSIPGD